jgi:hypothetical protein
MCPEDVGAPSPWSRSAISGAEGVYLFEDVASEVDPGRCPINVIRPALSSNTARSGKWSTGDLARSPARR